MAVVILTNNMKMRKQLFFFASMLGLIISFYSCDCLRQGTGIVMDSITDQPLDSVQIEAYLVNNAKTLFIKKVYTDTTGSFDIRTGFLVKDECKMGLILVFSKTGYRHMVIKDPKNASILMLKENCSLKYFDTIYKAPKHKE
jgi:5-hydroxyisourate hydrolase-like protein (transthyretin family)